MSVVAGYLSPGIGVPRLYLRIATALQLVGAAWLAWLYETAVGTTLWLNLGLSDQTVRALEISVAGSLILAVPAVLFTRSRVGPYFGASWLLLLAAAGTFQGGQFASDFLLGAYAARIGAPLALVALYAKRVVCARRILSLSLALTFVVHGFEAAAGHPAFVDFIIGSAAHIGVRIGEDSALSLLVGIGLADVVAAVLLLTTRSRPIMIYMAAWGAITAFSRMTHAGLPAGYETLLRAGHAFVPLALLLLCVREKDDSR